MAKITEKRTGEYLKTALEILKEKGGEYPSGELIKDIGTRKKMGSATIFLRE